MDPALAHASVEGMNALSRLWTYTSMALMALGYQVTEAEALLRAPEQWQAPLAHARRRFPDLQPAVDFFADFVDWPPELRARRADALLIKLMPFQVDPQLRALFGAAQWGFRWEEIVEQGKALILDFGREVNPERRRLKLLWSFLSLVEYLKARGIQGRTRPVSLMIDEITQLAGYGQAEQALLLLDLEELFSVIARNMGLWVTAAHQSLAQLDLRLANVLMQMGTQIIGVVPNPDDALYLARQFTTYDPYVVKKYEPVWMGVPDLDMLQPRSFPEIIDQRPVEFSSEEQLLLVANRFRALRRFAFLVRIARGEGMITGELRPMSIGNLDRNLYPDQGMVDEVSTHLMRRSGRPAAAILAEIDSRLPSVGLPPATPTRPQNLREEVATMKEYAHHLPEPAQGDEDDDETLREEA